MESTFDETTTTDSEEGSKKESTYDFAFVMKPASVLKNVFKGYVFNNPIQEGVIQIQQAFWEIVVVRGCEIVAWVFNLDAFGCLLLMATGLQGFQCKKPFRKSPSDSLPWDFGPTAPESIGLKEVDPAHEAFPDSISYGYQTVAMSKKLQNQATTHPETDLVPTAPETIGLRDVDPAYEAFPDSISYVYQTVVPSSVLEAMSRKLRYQATPRAETDFALGRPVNIDLPDFNTAYENYPAETYALEADMPSEKSRELVKKLRDAYAFKIPDSVELYLRRGGAVNKIVGDVATRNLEEHKDAIMIHWRRPHSLQIRVLSNCLQNQREHSAVIRHGSAWGDGLCQPSSARSKETPAQ